MKKIFALAISLPLFVTIVALGQVKNPQTEISNKLIHLRYLLPDQETGYYRSTRFDWSGVMSSLEFKGHNYFGVWNPAPYDPILHDAITGLVEEFTPLGYNEATVESSFVKIGVGVLRKPKEDKYNRFNYYQIEDHGTWKVKKKSDQISFTHLLENKDYAYEYVKTERLIPGKPILEISHTLINRGQRTIETSVYCHNFFVIDSTTIGPAYIVKFPFTIKAGEQKSGNIAYVKDNSVYFNRDLVKGEITSISGLAGFGSDPKDYDIRIENQKTGAGVRIIGDHPISRIVFWTNPKALCPEPYINIKIEPGKEFTWKLTYEFYELDIKK
jgi:hypothetical protein